MVNAGSRTYTWSNNGNLLTTGVMTNVFDAANRLTSTTRASTTLQVAYNGLNDRVRQTVGATTTSFILDSAGGLPEVISTTRGTSYLHLPGVIMAQNSSGQRVYLLPDGLGSIRQVMSGTTVVAQRDFDPYGNPISTPSVSTPPYGFTGEWWEQDAQLLHLRARWYAPGEGIFLSKDPVESEPPYMYVRGNPVNRIDPSGLAPMPPRIPNPNSCPTIDPECAKLLIEIIRALNMIKKRYDDIVENPLDLPMTGPKMTVESHQEQLEGWQTRLQRLLKEWAKRGCGDPPAGAWKMASIPAPVPKHRLGTDNIEFTPPETPPWWVPVGIGVGYIIWNLKGCVFGPVGCVVDLATPGI